MLDLVVTFITQYIGSISSWITVITFVPILWIWYDMTFGRRRRHTQWLAAVRRQPGTRPAILIADLLAGKDVRAAVDRFRAKDPTLDAIPDERIFTIQRDAWLTPDDAPALIREIRKTASEILRSGADVLHYFHAGPVFAAAVVGAEFANASCRVILYQNEQGQYVNFGPLRHPGF